MSRCPSSRAPGGGAAVLAALLAVACGGEDGGHDRGSLPYERLSDYDLFTGALSDQRPAAGVLPYQVASSLWADGAGKERFLALPPGGQATFSPDEDWGFPPGTIVVKTFWFPADRRQPDGPRRLLETRLLILGDGGWTGHTYVWNDEQTDAIRTVAGTRIDVETTDPEGAPESLDYLVPNTDQCANCHSRDDVMHLLGVVGPQTNRSIVVGGRTVNQLEWLADQGLFDGPLPDLGGVGALADPTVDGPVEPRARAWLHANCSHCHRPGGGAGRTGLVLLATEDDPTALGVCKLPSAAGPGTGGRFYDIVPGDPDASIMPFRIDSTDPAVKMPELPNRTPDPLGVQLVRDWIAGLTLPGCE
jgi:uncharacterized repeat protein (TIGR03806 family)